MGSEMCIRDRMNGGTNGAVTKAEMEQLVAKASANAGPVQTIRVEQAPLKITTDTEPYKM